MNKNKRRKRTADKTEQPQSLPRRILSSLWVNVIFTFLIPAVTIFTLEWIARGTVLAEGSNGSLFSYIKTYFASYNASYLLLLCVYIFTTVLSGTHLVGTILVGLLGNVPGIVTYYKLAMRGEPFLPWDLNQVDDLMAMEGMSFDIQLNMILTLLIFIALGVLAWFIKVPHFSGRGKDWIFRGSAAAVALAGGLVLIFGIFLSPSGSASIGVKEDNWMQDRYYRKYGVITGFLTNLQYMDIDKPAGYNASAVNAVLEDATQAGQGGTLYDSSYASATGQTEAQPNIIFVMAESFWDVTSLEGVVYDQEILPNLTSLKQEAAYGYAYSPSFGGGTCDVEFEAITGFSMENLPSGSKPYQQYITKDTFSLPNYLQTQGYGTLAIHGYGAKFWSRDTAYPNLGFDEFISSEDFVNPIYRRGFISDESMVDRIIEEYENHSDEPVFIHAVTMQNHTTYSRDRYPSSLLVNILEAPDAIEDSVIGQLEDCATGMRDMDAALGMLTDYLRQSDQPTIVVFWGDHMNPMSDGYSIFEETGMIERGDTGSPWLHQTPLLIWSNYYSESIDLGAVSTYNLSPLMMDLYGLEMPEFFQYLVQQYEVVHGRTRGITIHADGTIDEAITEEEQLWLDKHELLQYDLMFGEAYTPSYTS